MNSKPKKPFSRVIAVFVLLALSLGLLPVTSPALAAKSGQGTSTFTKIDLVANIETIGVIVSGSGLPKTAVLLYQKSGETGWHHTGHPLVLSNNTRLAGSLFDLEPATTYNIKVLDGITEISGAVTTQPEELQFTPTTILHVDDDAAAGGDGSRATPYKTIQEAVNHAGPGTQVLVADGVYHEAVSFPASGADGKWIQVKAEGSGAILDGSQTLSGNIWNVYKKGKVWYTGSPYAKYLARDGQRYYLYDNMKGITDGIGHNKVPMNEGWYMRANSSRLYVRSLDDPSKHTWQVPRFNHAFDIASRDWIWIEGFEMRYYGVIDGCGVCAKNASHLVVRDNKIHNMQLGVYTNWNGTEQQGNDTRIENNEMYDPTVSAWPWSAVKGTTMEGTAIVVRGHIGAIVRNNDLHNFFNGIYTGSSASSAIENYAVALDADIYDNRIHQIGDDALEPEGACVNHRFRDNLIDSTLVGVSLAPVTQGPVWVLRSQITNYTGTSFKWDLYSDGVVLIYHNTSWTNAGSLNAMSMIRPVHNVTMRNNIFQGNGFAFEEPFTGSTGHSWDYDNWYTTRISGPHFKWENAPYNTIPELCFATNLECNGHEAAPGFVNPTGGDFTLQETSPNVDSGILIPGIDDDFDGNAPDLGAFESAFDRIPTVTSIRRLNENPTNAESVDFGLIFSEAVKGLDAGDFELVISGDLTGASVEEEGLSGSGNIFIVTVNTGSQDGTINLKVKDDDSITDSVGHPLGGTGPGNGEFTSGETYTVIKSAPIELVSVTFISNKTNDGYVIESGENSNLGGGINATAATFYVGDNAEDRQFRTILDFNTSSLPDGAVIFRATLKVKKLSVTGTDPFLTHQNLFVDIKGGTFGLGALEVKDYQAAASLDAAGIIPTAVVDNWFSSALTEPALQFINKTGSTQFRLRFQVDDNDDMGADTVKFYSGDTATLANRPVLVIEYYLPQQ
jgi:hypothetical protein